MDELSAHDRDTLRRIESGLREQDPDLAERLAGFNRPQAFRPPTSHHRWWRLAPFALAALIAGASLAAAFLL